jgi:YVTN family beta-propeller protein
MSLILNSVFFDGFCFRLDEKCLFRGDQRVHLTAKEVQILASLLESPGAVVAKADLANALWPDGQTGEDSLFHHMSSLRKRLREAGSERPYIENISKVGYRFIAEVTPNATPDARAPPHEEKAPAPALQLAAAPDYSPTTLNSERVAGVTSRSVTPKWLIAIAGCAVIVAALFYSKAFSGNLPISGIRPATESEVLTAPGSLASPRLKTLIKVGRQPSSAVLLQDGKGLYVSESKSDSVSIIDPRSNQVVAHVAVGHEPTVLATSKDGERVYVAQAGGGVGIIDSLARSFKTVPGFSKPVMDLVLTPDGKSAYLAVGFNGLAKMNLDSEEIKIISTVVYARALALTPDGKRLYVSYQAGGPDGSSGHDSIGYFDTTTDRLEGTIKGFPNVGECLTVSPDDSQLWENGEDACDSPQYDHIGCPAVPAGLLNIISVSKNKLVRSVGVRGARLQCVTFAPNGQFAAVASTDHLILLRSSDRALLGSLAIGSSGKIAFTPDGSVAYAPLTTQSAVAVIQVGITIHPIRLTNRSEADGSIPLAIPSTDDFDAKSIDPDSLRLDGQPIKRTKEGMSAVSIEYVTGFEGHSLIVHFNVDKSKGAAKLRLTGTTYSGLPINGVVEPS